MDWLGNDYIVATSEQQQLAAKLSNDMPSFPAKGSLRETTDFNILKLS